MALRGTKRATYRRVGAYGRTVGGAARPRSAHAAALRIEVAARAAAKLQSYAVELNIG